MNIIIGHSNMDLDCIGSMVLVRYLYPGYVLVGSRHIHPVARNLYNLYKKHLDFMPASELKYHEIEHIIVVDTRSRQRIEEFLQNIPDFTGKITVYDHHPADEFDIEGAEVIYKEYGANTTLIGCELQKQGVEINSDDATIALVGVYADTGSFIHPNVTPEDFEIAAYLLQNGASLKLTKKFLITIKEEHQISILHDMINQLSFKNFMGHHVLMCYMELEKQQSGLAAVVEKIFELENSDAIFALFYFEKQKQVLIVARSLKDTFAVNEALKPFGGGGHIHAASALLKNMDGKHVFNNLQQYLKSSIKPAIRAEHIMSKNVQTIDESSSLMDASIKLENLNYTGAPVVSEDGTMTGFLTLRNIMKGRKADQMHAPVKAYMTKKVITGNMELNLREIENIFYNNNIGHLPIIHAKKLIGIITRTDFLNHMDKKKEQV